MKLYTIIYILLYILLYILFKLNYLYIDIWYFYRAEENKFNDYLIYISIILVIEYYINVIEQLLFHKLVLKKFYNNYHIP